MIGKIAALVILGLSAVLSVYKAGKYANGGKDVSEGMASAVAHVINSIILGLIFVALYLDY